MAYVRKTILSAETGRRRGDNVELRSRDPTENEHGLTRAMPVKPTMYSNLISSRSMIGLNG